MLGSLLGLVLKSNSYDWKATVAKLSSTQVVWKVSIHMFSFEFIGVKWRDMRLTCKSFEFLMRSGWFGLLFKNSVASFCNRCLAIFAHKFDFCLQEASSVGGFPSIQKHRCIDGKFLWFGSDCLDFSFNWTFTITCFAQINTIHSTPIRERMWHIPTPPCKLISLKEEKNAVKLITNLSIFTALATLILL